MNFQSKERKEVSTDLRVTNLKYTEGPNKDKKYASHLP